MIGTKVNHIAWGEGTVIEQNGGFITVEFADRTSKFIYPDAFKKFIKAVDPDVQTGIINSINAAKEEAEQKRLAEEAERKAAAELARLTKSKSTRPYVRTKRIAGKRMTFFVFQGDTFEKEYRGGYIWAPISDKGGSQPHHWTRLLDVREGDIILHSCDAHIQAISVAKDACYDCVQPAELAVEKLWEKDGRRVDCEYIRLNAPIKMSHFVSDIVRLCTAKYSPFDKFGSGNMGYLFELNRELARIFVAAAVKHNPPLKTVAYINEFLAEKDAD